MIDDTVFGFIPGNRTTDAVFILRRIQEEYLPKQEKLHMCFVDLEKAFDRLSRKVVEWAMRKKGIPKVLVGAVVSSVGLSLSFSLSLSLSTEYNCAKTKENVGTYLSEELEVDVGEHQGSVLSPLLFVIVIDVVTSEIKVGTLQEILCANDLVLVAETMAELHEKFYAWKSVPESKG